MRKNRSYVPALVKNAGDKVFIFRDNHSAVYIERNRNSVIYKNLMACNINGGIVTGSEAFNLSGLANEWLPLCRYKGNYYLYQDRDTINMGKRVITGSFFNYSDKRWAKTVQLQSATKLNNITWSFDIFDHDSDPAGKTVIIHIIDSRSGIAVWEDVNAAEDEKYKLYVPKEHALQFDMIVDSSARSRAAGFKFDQPDFDALLKGLIDA